MRAYERLLRYVTYPTASNEANTSCPSTPEQLEFGKALVEEMVAMGIADANIDGNGYVFGTIPAAKPDAKGPVIGFVAHMDVSADAPCQPVNPRIVEYRGGDIILSEGIVLSPSEFPVLAQYKGGGLVVSDGKTLLGCDDKAGIAAILTMAEYFLANPQVEHGAIKIGFTPDEEIGRGADLFDVERFGADFAYTVDGAAFGEVEYETFNASAATVTVTGRSMHPGASKNKMQNASLMAMELAAMLPAAERPEHTEGYEGFYHLTSMEGEAEKAVLRYILRDHDADKLRSREEFLRNAAHYLNSKYGGGAVTVEIKESYRNMSSVLKDKANWHLIENAYKAVEQVGGTPVSCPVRGGTDGARLSFMGLPCPNLGTGSHNHHSRMEFASVQAMDKVAESLVKIAEIYTDFEIEK
ncbi:MAG: peptidase T [Defluviitaleaceae bacterium]|nr:peptidase T [Defluviitaleaceae bacterium]